MSEPLINPYELHYTGDACLECGKQDIIREGYQRVAGNDERMTRACYCPHCKSEWTDIYSVILESYERR